MSKYVLENKKEVDRLETQAKLKNYNLTEELKYLDLKGHKRVLDAGCGSGLLGNHLKNAYPKMGYVGCDASELRLEGAKKIYPHLTFLKLDLFELEQYKNVPDFDVIINRYVLHHLPHAAPLLETFNRALPMGGLCYIVDIEGLLVNLGTTDIFLLSCLQKIRTNFYGRLEEARFIPKQLHDAGFKDVKWKVQLMEFQDEDKISEADQFSERFEMAKEHLVQYLGDEFTYKKFLRHFFEEMKKPEVCLYYNKVIAWGKKV